MKRALLFLILLPTLATAQPVANDGKPLECGISFTARDSVAGVGLYKPPYNKWVIHLWDSTGALVDSATLPVYMTGNTGVSFAAAHAPGKYTLSYYSASGDYVYQYDYYAADSAYPGYSTRTAAGVFGYGYGKPSTPGFRNSDYLIRPVCKSTYERWPSLSDPRWTFVVMAPADGGPAMLTDHLSLRKAIFGFDPPGPPLEPPFTRRIGTTVYRYTLYVWGTKREKFAGGKWIDAPY